jgi:hypothetical protein
MAIPAVYLIDDLERSNSALTERPMIAALVDRYRCPESLLPFQLSGPLSEDTGYVRLGRTICYGRSGAGHRSPQADCNLYDLSLDVKAEQSKVLVPFDPTELIDNLRLERYARRNRLTEWNWRERLLRDAYYRLRPLMGGGLRKALKRFHAAGWRNLKFPNWPVDTSVEQLSESLLLAAMKAKGIHRMPFVWFWPKGAASCVVVSHDVEDRAGYDFCPELMDMDQEHGIAASFQFVPEGKYTISESLLQEVRQRGFEVNIQDLSHDGYLFADRQEFLRRVRKINRYGRLYSADGFRSAVLYRNLDWYDALDFSYDMSVPNVAHLDPQRGGCCTVMPYFIGDVVEIPVTTIQDYMLFYLLGDYSIELWKKQAENILDHHGLISFLVHPDYVLEGQARKAYLDLLVWLQGMGSSNSLWFALPREVDRWWRARSQMQVVQDRRGCRIEGPDTKNAVLAFAKLVDDHIEYEVDV